MHTYRSYIYICMRGTNGIDRKLGSGWLAVLARIPVKREEYIQEMSPRIRSRVNDD